MNIAEGGQRGGKDSVSVAVRGELRGSTIKLANDKADRQMQRYR